MGKCRTYPVFYGQTTVAGTQNYLVTTDPYGDYINMANLTVATNTGGALGGSTTLKEIASDHNPLKSSSAMAQTLK